MKRVLVVCCCAVLFCAALFAEDAAQAKPAIVSGVVVKSGTAEPVKKARVTLFSSSSTRANRDPLTATTDATGSFEFPAVPPGEYRAIASRSGFATTGFSRLAAGELINVHAGEQVRTLTLRISPSAAVTGRVLDEDGEPLAHVSIAALQYRYLLNTRRMIPVGTGQTDDRGEFRIGELRPGRYYLQATAAQTEAPKGMRYGSRYYPDATTPDAASPLQLRAGDEVETTLHLTPGHAVTVKGVIVDANPNQHYSVMLRPRGLDFTGFDGGQAEVQDGTFTLRDVLPGEYTLEAFSIRMPAPTTSRGGGGGGGAFEPEMTMTQQDIQVGETDIDGVRLNLTESRRRLVEVAGEIKLESAKPMPLDELYVGAQPTRIENIASMFGMAQGGSAAVKKNGTFSFQLSSGTHYFTNIYANGQSFADYYTKSVLYGGREVTEAGFTVGSTPGKLQIVVAEDGARIEGTVHNAAQHPFSNATVVAVPEEKYRNWYEDYGRAQTDQNGRFTMRGLRPGDYKLFAWEDMEDGAFMDAEYMKPFDQLGVIVHAKSNGRYDVSLKLIPDAGDE